LISFFGFQAKAHLLTGRGLQVRLLRIVIEPYVIDLELPLSAQSVGRGPCLDVLADHETASSARSSKRDLQADGEDRSPDEKRHPPGLGAYRGFEGGQR